jgi:hypothetical protein
MSYVDPNDPARGPDEYSARPVSDVPDRDGVSRWGFPLIVVAALVILGFIFFGTHERATTATNNTSAPAAENTPAPAPAAPAAPTKQ